jgi:putative tryptophan/tyrosine transport system substrate-binding protein
MTRCFRLNAVIFFALWIAGLLAPFATFAQQPQPIHRIGMLVSGGPSVFIDALTDTLRELGYIEGKNVSIERRFAEGNLDRLPALAAELVRLRVDIIVAQGTPATLVAKQATTSIPIVFCPLSDPVGVGIVASLARPGGNATGTSLMAPDLSAKRLELLRAVVPRLSRIAILWDSANPGMALRVRETKTAADQSGLAFGSVGPRNLEELDAAFAELTKQHPDALLVTTEPFTRRHLTRILEFASSNRIPTMFEDKSYVDGGGLMSYGPNLLDGYRRAVTYVDKIFKGAKPADLPVEQPTKFELTINTKTANALGITFPRSILVRADRAVE